MRDAVGVKNGRVSVPSIDSSSSGGHLPTGLLLRSGTGSKYRSIAGALMWHHAGRVSANSGLTVRRFNIHVHIFLTSKPNFITQSWTIKFTCIYDVAFYSITSVISTFVTYYYVYCFTPVAQFIPSGLFLVY